MSYYTKRNRKRKADSAMKVSYPFVVCAFPMANNPSLMDFMSVLSLRESLPRIEGWSMAGQHGHPVISMSGINGSDEPFPVRGFATDMAATVLGPTEKISPSLRRGDFSTHTSSRTEKNSPLNQLLEDKVTDLCVEHDKLRREIAQWHDLREETIANMNRHNSRLEEDMSKNTDLRLKRQRLLEENMFIESKHVEALQHRLLASSGVKDHALARHAMCKTLSEFQKILE